MEENKGIEGMKRLVGACPACNRRPAALTIQRIPDNTLKQFKEMSNEEFKGDYGFTLKHLLDFYYGLIHTGWEHLEIKLQALEDEIIGLKEKLVSKEEEKKYRSMADGSRKEIN